MVLASHRLSEQGVLPIDDGRHIKAALEVDNLNMAAVVFIGSGNHHDQGHYRVLDLCQFSSSLNAVVVADHQMHGAFYRPVWRLLDRSVARFLNAYLLEKM
jgi:hypothetical protein